jgi:hypothetical protein
VGDLTPDDGAPSSPVVASLHGGPGRNNVVACCDIRSTLGRDESGSVPTGCHALKSGRGVERLVFGIQTPSRWTWPGQMDRHEAAISSLRTVAPGRGTSGSPGNDRETDGITGMLAARPAALRGWRALRHAAARADRDGQGVAPWLRPPRAGRPRRPRRRRPRRGSRERMAPAMVSLTLGVA